MEFKECPNCGQRLPEEANFCPYCMTKITEENFVSRKNNKIVRRKYTPFICIALVCLIGCIVFIEILHKRKDNVSEAKQDVAEGYEQYLGVWFDEKPNNKINLAGYYGKRIEIVWVHQDYIIFNIESFSKDKFKNAFLEDMKVRLNNGEGSFSFSDDGCGNQGSGNVTLLNGKVHVHIELNSHRSNGLWDISMDQDFVQVQKFKQNQKVEIKELLSSFRKSRSLLGNRTEILEYGDSLTYIYNNGLNIELKDSYDIGEFYITEVTIDYSLLKSDFQYQYKGIDNHSSRDDVKKRFGKKRLLEIDGNYQYDVKSENRVVTFYFDEKGMVNSINYRVN